MTGRTYQQHCGLACALDVVGERWTLLVVRELVSGPKRFRDLQANLPGIGTNLLAARLKRLADAEVVAKVPVQGTQVLGYELTARGAELLPALETLAVWGSRRMAGDPDGAAVRASWAALSMQARARADRLEGLDGAYGFLAGGERFHLAVAAGLVAVRQGWPASELDAEVTGALDGFFALATGKVTAADAARDGLVEVRGDVARLQAILDACRLAAPADDDERGGDRGLGGEAVVDAQRALIERPAQQCIHC